MNFTFTAKDGTLYHADSYDLGSAAMAVREAMGGKLPYIDKGGNELYGLAAQQARQFDVGSMGEAVTNQNQRNLHLQHLSSMGITPVVAKPDTGTTQSMRAPNAGDSGPIAGGLLGLSKEMVKRGQPAQEVKQQYLKATAPVPSDNVIGGIGNAVTSAKNLTQIAGAVAKGAVDAKTPLGLQDYIAGGAMAGPNAIGYLASNAVAGKVLPADTYSDFWHATAPNMMATLDTETGFKAGLAKSVLSIASPEGLSMLASGPLAIGIMAASAPSMIGHSIEKAKTDPAGVAGEVVGFGVPLLLGIGSKVHSDLVNEGAIRYGLRNLGNLSEPDMVKLADGVNASKKFGNVDPSLPLPEALQNVTPLNINKPTLADSTYLKAAKSTLSNLIVKTPDGYDVTLINGKKIGIRYGADQSQTSIVDPVTGEKLMGYDDAIWLKDGAGDPELKHELFHTVVRLGLVPPELIDAGIKRYGSVEEMAKQYENYQSPSGPLGYLKQLGGKLVDLVSDRGKLAFTRMAERIDNMDAFARPSEAMAPMEPAYYGGKKANATATDVVNNNEIAKVIRDNFAPEDITKDNLPDVRDLVTDEVVRKSRQLSDDPALRQKQIEVIRNNAERLISRKLRVDTTSPSDSIINDTDLTYFVDDRTNLKDLTDVVNGDPSNVDKLVSAVLDFHQIPATDEIKASPRSRINTIVTKLHDDYISSDNAEQLNAPIKVKDFAGNVENKTLPVDAGIASPKKSVGRTIIDFLDEHFNDEHAPMLSALKEYSSREVDPVFKLFGVHKPTLNLLEVDLRLYSGSAARTNKEIAC